MPIKASNKEIRFQNVDLYRQCLLTGFLTQVNGHYLMSGFAPNSDIMIVNGGCSLLTQTYLQVQPDSRLFCHLQTHRVGFLQMR